MEVPLAVDLLPLAFAVVVLPLGGFVLSLLARSHRWGELLTSSVNLLAWLLIAMGAVLILYAFFPTSEASGAVLGISVGGGLAAFTLIWLLGTRWTREDIAVDRLKGERDTALDEAKRLRTLHDGTPDAPIEHELTSCRLYEYRLTGSHGKRLTLVTGNLRGVKRSADVWVNSENTHMQMARFFDRSVSATIRYLGAAKGSVAQEILEDTIADELTRVVAGKPVPLQPGTVIATGAGALAGTHGVTRVFHVAAVHGEAATGYRPVADLGHCVTACLECADNPDERSHRLESILFPLLGSGTGRGGRERPVEAMLDAAIDYLEVNPHSSIKNVCFLAWTDDDLAACQRVCGSSQRLLDASSRRGTAVASRE